jgi:glutamyl-tRNA reductase
VNLLVVGMNHRTAPVRLLEQAAVPAAELPVALSALMSGQHVGEVVLLSTCNRVEVYAAVSAFHGALNEVGQWLSARTGVHLAPLADHLYIHYADEAVRHLFTVSAGLDSMVVGEAQILGQLRDAYGAAQELGAPGRLLHELMQQALRVGKRVHAETGIGAAGRSVVTAALDLAAAELDPAGPASGRPPAPPTGRSDAGGLAGHGALVIGAGAIGALALARLARGGAGPLFVANRGGERAARLAGPYRARAVELRAVAGVLPEVDVVVSATASARQVLPAGTVAAALARRPAGRRLVICDLAVPRDVDPAAATLPGVVLIDTARLAGTVPEAAADAVAAAEAIVAAEAGMISAALGDTRVAPTVAALRTRADELVAAELARLAQRRPDLTDEQRAEVAHSLHRLVQRLLHQPTVRVRQLATGPDGHAYAAVLADLFDLRIPHPDRADQVPSLAEQPGEPEAEL